MIMYYDSDYQETKQIMLGNQTMKPEFKKLAEWIDKTYAVKTINIIYDTIDEGKRPRLQICFEFENEKTSFYDKNNLNYRSDTQQAIQQQFQQLLEDSSIPKSAFYFSDNLWVIYGGFEPLARMEANGKIPEEKVLALKEELNNPELWYISRAFSAVTFFLYTEEQVKKYKDSAIEKIWADKYFDLLDQYNEFGYFKRDSFQIYLDSKENFDTNYASNWYYYYK